MTGRTVMGKMPPRNQEVCDHYMSPPNLTSPALACMQEIQEQCFKLGIPLRTRHREVAPNQVNDQYAHTHTLTLAYDHLFLTHALTN